MPISPDNLFSAYAEVIPTRRNTTLTKQPLLRVCGGNSQGHARGARAAVSSPRMRR